MVQSGAPAQISVAYGTFVFDETAGILIDKADGVQEAYASGRYAVEFTVRVTSPSNTGTVATDVATDIANFRTLLANLVAACRIPRQRLQVKYGGTAVLDYNPALGSSLTAFHVQPLLEPLSSDDDSLMAKRFRFSATFDHSADLGSQNGRADSNTQYLSTIRERRTQPITATFTALLANDALAQYRASTTNTWFLGQLQAPVAGGEWELATETLSWDDEGTGGRTLSATRTYFEAVNGLREWNVAKTLTPSQALQVTISGFYIPTSTYTSAKAAHDADLGTFVTNTLGALYPGVPFDTKPTATQESKTTVDGMYPFSVAFEQIVFPQGPGGVDDPNVTTFTLSVNLSTPFDANTVVSGAKPQSLQTATALYSAAIDVNSAGGTDMQSLWASKYQAHCAAAIKAKLKATNVLTRTLDLGLDLTANRIAASVACLVWNSNVLSLLISEQTEETPAGNPVPMASSEAHEYWLFWGVASLTLTRVAQCEYIAGTTAPEFWPSGGLASGFKFIDVGWPSWEAARDAVNKRTFTLKGSAAPAASGGSTVDRSTLSTSGAGGWYPLSKTPLRVPKTVGDTPGLSTVTLGSTEKWLYMSKCNISAPTASPAATSNRQATYSGLSSAGAP